MVLVEVEPVTPIRIHSLLENDKLLVGEGGFNRLLEPKTRSLMLVLSSPIPPLLLTKLIPLSLEPLLFSLLLLLQLSQPLLFLLRDLLLLSLLLSTLLLGGRLLLLPELFVGRLTGQYLSIVEFEGGKPACVEELAGVGLVVGAPFVGRVE
jgi:hypothetical protein